MSLGPVTPTTYPFPLNLPEDADALGRYLAMIKGPKRAYEYLIRAALAANAERGK